VGLKVGGRAFTLLFSLSLNTHSAPPTPLPRTGNELRRFSPPGFLPQRRAILNLKLHFRRRCTSSPLEAVGPRTLLSAGGARAPFHSIQSPCRRPFRLQGVNGAGKCNIRLGGTVPRRQPSQPALTKAISACFAVPAHWRTRYDLWGEWPFFERTCLFWAQYRGSVDGAKRLRCFQAPGL